MSKLYSFISVTCLSLLLTLNCFAQNQDIVLTIDDLPFVGESKNFHLNMIINALKSNQVQATGFVIAKDLSPSNFLTLHKFRDAGLSLGNHTLSHKNLSKVPAKTFIEEIDAADKILDPLLTTPKFFRYPYLAMSSGAKKDKVLKFLQEKKYQIAYITIDSKDFTFNQLLMAVPQEQRFNFLKVLKPCYLAFIWQQTLKAKKQSELYKSNKAQILLIHANLLNAYVLPDIINMYKENGFNFISLEETFGAKPKEMAIQAPQQLTSKLFKWN